jgi:hypothetical protein
VVVASGGPQFVLSSVPDPYTTSVDVTDRFVLTRLPTRSVSRHEEGTTDG